MVKKLLLLTFLLVITACVPAVQPSLAPSSIPVQVSTPTFAPSFTATNPPTLTPTIQPSPTPDPAISGDGGVLTLVQKQRLAAAAIKYVAPTESEAIKVARSIGYLVNEGHPASMCGPLSLVILQKAGLIDPAIDLHSFWYLDPRPGVDYNLVKASFPPEHYQWISLHTSIDKIDFKANPLFAGDFIYIYAGSYGTFEHVITVDRVDSSGRAYTVTNLHGPDGYTIKEVMLYDPANPGIGQIHDWTNFKNLKYGVTGFGGMDIWRRSDAISDPTTTEETLQQAIQSIIQSTGGHWNLSFSEIGGHVFYERLAFEQIHPASTIKVPIALLFFKALENMGVTDVKNYIDTHAIMKRPMSELLRAMLVYSEEEATGYLMNWTVSSINYEKALSEWGINETTLTPRRTTLHDMTLIYTGLYTGTMVSPAARQIILDLLNEYTPNDDTRLGVLRPLLGSDGVIYNKRGTMTADHLIVADTAIITYKLHAYTLLVYAQPEVNQTGPTYEQLDAAFPEIAKAAWEFLQTLP